MGNIGIDRTLVGNRGVYVRGVRSETVFGVRRKIMMRDSGDGLKESILEVEVVSSDF